MQPHQSVGGDYAIIQPCGHLWSSATLVEVLDSEDALPCKHIKKTKQYAYIKATDPRYVRSKGHHTRWKITQEVHLNYSGRENPLSGKS